MNSLDTNILFYATNSACPEHECARAVVTRALEMPAEWIVADQVLLKYDRLLRNPLLLEKPLSAGEAAGRLRWFREETGWRRCCWDRECWVDTFSGLSGRGFQARRTFDLALAVTLRRNGVKTLFTRNKPDFAAFGWFEVVDPLA